jgi:predicted transcriptional regulator
MEKDLIFKLKGLSRIKPEKRWVKRTKREILGPQFPIFQPILIGSLLLLIGVFVFAQKSLPGEKLYAIKKITERAKTFFVSSQEKPKVDLEIAAKRMEELRQIAEKNDVKKLPVAIKEVKEVSAVAAKSLKQVKKPDKEIVQKTKEILENKTLAQKTLGTEIETPLDETYKVLAENLIKEVENSSLTENQKEVLKKAKEFFEKGDFASAFLKVVEISQIR